MKTWNALLERRNVLKNVINHLHILIITNLVGKQLGEREERWLTRWLIKLTRWWWSSTVRPRREEIYNNGGDFASNYVPFSQYHRHVCCFVVYSERSWIQRKRKKRSLLSVTEGPTAFCSQYEYLYSRYLIYESSWEQKFCFRESKEWKKNN